PGLGDARRPADGVVDDLVGDRRNGGGGEVELHAVERQLPFLKGDARDVFVGAGDGDDRGQADAVGAGGEDGGAAGPGDSGAGAVGIGGPVQGGVVLGSRDVPARVGGGAAAGGVRVPERAGL